MFLDIIILILFAFGFLIGAKRGFTKQIVSLVGVILILVLSFVLKNPISLFMYKFFPFFSFKGLAALNILLYETISFVLVFSILFILLRILIMLTSVFEKILNMTIILGIPSKILGGIGGIIENYILIFVVLYFLSFPVFNLNIRNSKIANFMLNKTPIVSHICDNTLSVFEDFKELKEQYKGVDNLGQLNQKSIELFIKYDIISEKNANDLISKGKIKI